MYERYCELRDSLGYRDSDVSRNKAIFFNFSSFGILRPFFQSEKVDFVMPVPFATSVDYLRYGDQAPQYYLNDETAKMAQEIFDNKELRMLFDAARDAAPEDLEAAHTMILALKRKERKNIDD